MAELSPEEKVLVKQVTQFWEKFRNNVQDVLEDRDEFMKNDHYLIRWIRARDLNLQKAETMLRDSMKWRAENNVDTLLHGTLPEFLYTEYPYDLNTKDKEGRLVMIIPIGSWDVRKVVDSGKTTEFIQYTNTMFERILDKIKTTKSPNPNWPHTQVTIICDCGGFSFTQLVNIKAAQGMLQMASTYEAHYPEILFRCHLLNCAYAFSLFFKLLKPILAHKTMSKIVIYGCNRDEWIPALLESVDEKELPEYYGGKNERKLSWL